MVLNIIFIARCDVNGIQDNIPAITVPILLHHTIDKKQQH